MVIIFPWTLLWIVCFWPRGISLRTSESKKKNPLRRSIIISQFCSDRSRRIYNVTSSAEIKVSWNQVIEMGREIVTKRIPLNGVLWYPGGSMKNNRLYHNFCMIFYHFLPAIVLDALLFCLGYKPVWVWLFSAPNCYSQSFFFFGQKKEVLKINAGDWTSTMNMRKLNWIFVE